MGEGQPDGMELVGCCSPKERCFPSFCPGLKKKKENGDFLRSEFYQTAFK